MGIEQLVQRGLDLSINPTDETIPENHISRQKWQEVVECLLKNIRSEFKSPAFGLSEAEISLHYHRPLADFYKLISKNLGCSV